MGIGMTKSRHLVLDAIPLSGGAGGPGALSLGSSGSQSIPVWALSPPCPHGNARSCRSGILGSPLPALHLYSQALSPARRWQAARPGIHFKAAFVFLLK